MPDAVEPVGQDTDQEAADKRYSGPCGVRRLDVSLGYQHLAPHGLRLQQYEQALNTDTSRLRLRFGQWSRLKVRIVHIHVWVRRESRGHQTSIRPRNCGGNQGHFARPPVRAKE